MYYISIYFIIGIALNLIYECIAWWLRKNKQFVEKLSDLEKLLALILWPIGLIVFLDGFFKSIYKNK